MLFCAAEFLVDFVWTFLSESTVNIMMNPYGVFLRLSMLWVFDVFK